MPIILVTFSRDNGRLNRRPVKPLTALSIVDEGWQNDAQTPQIVRRWSRIALDDDGLEAHHCLLGSWVTGEIDIRLH
jgi:hypothetical protein